MSDMSQNEYLSRIYKVQDYIEINYFKNTSVEQLAKIAGFSKYHFNRIFKSVLNESISQYVNRIRIESRDVCPFEVYLNNPMEELDHHIEVDIYMPIEPI